MSTGEAGVSRTSAMCCLIVFPSFFCVLVPGALTPLGGGSRSRDGNILTGSRDQHRAQPPQCGVNISFFCLYMKI